MLLFVTDTRSEKAEQIAHSPLGEVCWYFQISREQFRISGKLFLVGEGKYEGVMSDPPPAWLDLRREMWANMSAATKATFSSWAPGRPKTPAEEVEPLGSEGAEAKGDVDVASPFFALLLLEPARVDHLRLKMPQQRCERVGES